MNVATLAPQNGQAREPQRTCRSHPEQVVKQVMAIQPAAMTTLAESPRKTKSTLPLSWGATP
jgi:hypothetical protein